MKPFLISFLTVLLACSSSVAQNKCKDCISWSEDRKLTWADFKGKPNQSSPNEALTDSGMSIELKCDGTISEAIIKCYYNPKKSWTKSTDSQYLLAHEQLHFDITELFVRKLRKELQKFGNDCQKLSSHIEDYYNRNYKEFVKYQDAYDHETNHSLNKDKQAYWHKKVENELAELEEFASSAKN